MSAPETSHISAKNFSRPRSVIPKLDGFVGLVHSKPIATNFSNRTLGGRNP